MKPTLKPIAFLCLLALSVACNAQRIELADLGELDTDFAEALPRSEYPGAQLLLTARALSGDAFALRLPFRPNRITRRVAAGQSVAAGSVVARVSGPELAAWQIEAEAVEAQFTQAQARFRANERLFASGALSAAQWKDISDAYYQLQQEMHHVEHVREVLRMVASEGDFTSADLLAPVAGHVMFPDETTPVGEELTVASFVAADSLRLTGRVSLGADPREGPVALGIGTCRAAVAEVEDRVQALSRRVWSTANPPCAQLVPGATYAGRALYRFDGVTVPRSALLRHGGRAGVLVKNRQALEFVAAEILAEDETRYYLATETPVAGEQVLSRSVSAVQGMLLGLGSN